VWVQRATASRAWLMPKKMASFSSSPRFRSLNSQVPFCIGFLGAM
jgi:hypothetical protein